MLPRGAFTGKPVSDVRARGEGIAPGQDVTRYPSGEDPQVKALAAGNIPFVRKPRPEHQTFAETVDGREVLVKGRTDSKRVVAQVAKPGSLGINEMPVGYFGLIDQLDAEQRPSVTAGHGTQARIHGRWQVDAGHRANPRDSHLSCATISRTDVDRHPGKQFRQRLAYGVVRKPIVDGPVAGRQDRVPILRNRLRQLIARRSDCDHNAISVNSHRLQVASDLPERVPRARGVIAQHDRGGGAHGRAEAFDLTRQPSLPGSDRDCVYRLVAGGAKVGRAQGSGITARRSQTDCQDGTDTVRLELGKPIDQPAEVPRVLIEASKTGRKADDSRLHVRMKLAQPLQAVSENLPASNLGRAKGFHSTHHVIGERIDHKCELALERSELTAVPPALHPSSCPAKRT